MHPGRGLGIWSTIGRVWREKPEITTIAQNEEKSFKFHTELPEHLWYWFGDRRIRSIAQLLDLIRAIPAGESELDDLKEHLASGLQTWRVLPDRVRKQLAILSNRVTSGDVKDENLVKETLRVFRRWPWIRDEWRRLGQKWCVSWELWLRIGIPLALVVFVIAFIPSGLMWALVAMVMSYVILIAAFLQDGTRAFFQEMELAKEVWTGLRFAVSIIAAGTAPFVGLLAGLLRDLSPPQDQVLRFAILFLIVGLVAGIWAALYFADIISERQGKVKVSVLNWRFCVTLAYLQLAFLILPLALFAGVIVFN